MEKKVQIDPSEYVPKLTFSCLLFLYILFNLTIENDDYFILKGHLKENKNEIIIHD